MLNSKLSRVNKIVCFLILFFVWGACERNEEIIEAKALSFDKNNISQVRFVGQWLNEGKRGELLKKFVREYEFKNQEVEIILKFPEEIMTDFSDRTSNVKFVSDLIYKENPPWDIIRINNQIKAIAESTNDSLWAKNNLVDFSEIPEFRSNTLPKLLTDEVKNMWGGIIPGPFLEGIYWALWTNKQVADKLGIQVKSKGMSIEDFISYIKAVDTYNKANPQDYITPLFDAYDWQTSSVLVFQLYASALNNNAELFSNSITNEKLVAWNKTLLALEELAVYNPINPNWESVIWEEANTDLIHEKCLFYSNGSWMYNIWEKTDAEKTKNAFPNEYPGFNKIEIYPSSYYITWGVLKKSPNKDEAVKLLLALNSADVAEMWVQYTKCPTGIKGRLTDLTFGMDQFEGFSNYVQSNYGDNIYNFSDELNLFGNYSIGNSNYREVLTGKMTAEQAMAIVSEKLSVLETY